MRVIGGLGFNLALGAPRFGTADRGHARGLCRGGRREGCGRCLRLRAGTAAGALGMPRFAFAALVATRLALARLSLPLAARGSRSRRGLRPPREPSREPSRERCSRG